MEIKKTLNSRVLVDSNMRIIPEVLDFANSMVQRELSINTVQSYLRDLKVYYEWLFTEELKFYEVKPRDIQRFIRYIDNRHVKGKVSPATLGRYLATLSSFYGHHHTMGGWVTENPIVKVNGFNHPNANKGYLSHTLKPFNEGVIHYFKRKKKKSKIDRKRLYPSEVESIYNAIRKHWENYEGLAFRNQLIFKVLYETGMRIGELLHLQIDDFDNPDPIAKTGNIYLVDRIETDENRQLKSGERVIPVKTSLLAKIDDYILLHRPYKEGEKYLFVSHKGDTLGEPIRRNSIEDFFSLISKKCNIKCTPHSLRHTHASELTDKGLDPLLIKHRLGHSNINTTAKYAKPSLETMITAYERYCDQNTQGACSSD